MSFADIQTIWADALVGALVGSGVRRIVVSPGSRSTPVVLAVARREKSGDVDVSVVIDERSAAFLALGHARATGEPALLVCTSGTAGGHYLPALIEASEARLPVLVLTADRPPELLGRGAPQTTDQRFLYAGFNRRSFQLGPAEGGSAALRGLVGTASLAVHASRWPEPGPVHLNVALRKPLEPDRADPFDDDVDLRRALDSLPVIDVPVVHADPAALRRLTDRLADSKRPLLVMGPAAPADAASPASVAEFIEAIDIPVLAESTSQHRFGTLDPRWRCDIFEPLFGSRVFRERGAPDFVLQVGGAPTGRNLGAWIAGSGVERWILARHGVPEAYNQAARIVVGDLSSSLSALAGQLREAVPERAAEGAVSGAARAEWCEAITRWSGRAADLVEADAATREAEGPASRTTPVMRALVEAQPPGGQIVVGNSLPVREIDLHVRQSARGLVVLSQRGVAGIDGLIAGAAGAAVSGRPTTLLLGDVSFQHDVGSLAVAADSEAPLAIVVINNGGGRLFELLPVRDLDGIDHTFEKYFLTRPRLDVERAAAAFGVTCERPESPEELRSQLGRALGRPGPTVIEIVVEPRDGLAVRRVAEVLDRELASDEGCFPA